MAKVEMPLEELRELEKKRDDALALVKVKQEEIKEVQLKFREVEASKRVIRKTIREKDTSWQTITSVSLKESEAMVVVERAISDTERMLMDRMTSARGYSREPTHYLGEAMRMLREPLIRNLTRVNVAVPHQSKPFQIDIPEETTEYINFEDVQRELREKAEESVSKELGELRSKVKNLSEEYAEGLEDARKDYESILKDRTKQYEEIVKSQLDCYKELQEKYDALKEDKDMRATEQKLLDEIQKLKEELALETGKPWWKKLFGA